MTHRQAKPIPPLRPRLDAWFRAAGVALPVPTLVGLVLLAQPWPSVNPALWLWGGLSILGLGVVAAEIIQERWRRPAVLRYWRDDDECVLQVRNKRTGHVVLRCPVASLAGSELRSASLSGVNLAGVRLRKANLAGADLRGADLRCADLTCANLERAKLQGADLRGARLIGANLENADLSHVCLSTALLHGASLRGADLRGTNFVGKGAERVLWGSELRGVELKGARCNVATRWPRGFDPKGRGCLYEYGKTTEFPIPAERTTAGGDSLPIPLNRAREEVRPLVLIRG